MKKVLSIVLSIVMVLCMMPAMAFADTATVGFTDDAAIEHDVAVDTLVALGVLEGYPDGSFQPAKVVTRAEMAKIVATVLNGGEAPVLSTTTTSYGDTQGHWAAGYIEYCTSLGIVEGVGAGQFAPNAPVTAEQAAKMILVAQGYNATVEGMTGAKWASNTNVLANQNGLYEDLSDIVTEAGASRDAIAQMIYNVLDANVITKTNTVNADGTVSTHYGPSNPAQSVGTKYFGYTEVPGKMSKVEYTAKTELYTYTVSGSAITCADDYTELFGMDVKALVKDGKAFGFFADDCSVVYEGVKGTVDTADAANKNIKINGTALKLNTASSVPNAMAEFDATTEVAIASVDAFEMVKVIDIANDGDIDRIVYSPVEIDSVKFVGKKTVQFDAHASLDFADHTIYSDIAEDDFVMITTDIKAPTKKVVTELETLKDVKVDSTKGTTATINGVSYNNAASVVAGKEYSAVGILNGYIVKATEKSTNSTDLTKYAVLVGKKTVTDYNNTYYAKLLGTDGTEKEVVLKNSTAIADGELVTYTVKDDKYTLEVATTAAITNEAIEVSPTALFVKKTTDTDAYITGGAFASGVGIAADAVVFVKSADAAGKPVYSVISGEELAAKTEAPVLYALSKLDKATGFNKIVLAYIESPEATTDAYAYVTDNTVTNSDGTNTTYDVNLSTGLFTTVKGVNATTAAIAKGDYVKYTVNADGKISDIAEIATTDAAVTAYDGKNITLTVSGGAVTTTTLAKDATIIYVDSTAKTVADGGKIVLATKATAESNYTHNVRFVLGDSGDNAGKVVFLVVDVNNDMK